MARARARPPSRSISRTTSEALSSRRSATATRAPSREKAIAISRPIPSAAPVTTATLPCVRIPPAPSPRDLAPDTPPSARLAPGRLLPRQAVNRAETPDEVSRVYADDRPVAEELPEDSQGLAVLHVVEGGDEDRGVGDVEVRIGRRQPAAVERDRRRHRERHDLRARPVLEPQI